MCVNKNTPSKTNTKKNLKKNEYNKAPIKVKAGPRKREHMEKNPIAFTDEITKNITQK
jgi:hypothetical protein